MSGDYEDMSVFEQIKAGLQDGIAWQKGQLALKTTEFPDPPPKASKKDIQALRRDVLEVTQAHFAAILGVTPKTVQSWEQGAREPSGVALRLIQFLDLQPTLVKKLDSSKRGRRKRRVMRSRGRVVRSKTKTSSRRVTN